MKVDEMVNVMAAYANGEDIEFRLADVDTTESDWSYVASPTWDWRKYEYRIAPSKTGFPNGVNLIGGWIGYRGSARNASACLK